eukprot:Gregarina_sp_Pseudo_9__3429@NODE_35_length_5456_cov_132_485693_g32_i0_p7_GENE_NODE_35_length_5456_cov_132_485693_g32_i0NODE_35_length_5456_cov_132_485693_g32_i0_p7_ORF_typecomplete_len152_score38_51Clathrin_lg_ch/PF01086_17/0_0017RMI1_C/PF16099_5/1_1e03RMI1_C/PF16099_5/0_0019MRVI1/PF05781_12/0_026Mulike_Pro/PF10123_9/0_082DUF3552/PF12072_8/0_12MIS13/PF08202_11/0_37Rep_facA_C/PF08646_10/3_7e02Rep_facA_C/PF08646_10/2Cytochrom_C_2/PF01322_20/5_4Cytochrom_C_2/PF01322_20/14Phage_Nu1/PF07471_12/3_2FUS
MSQEWMAKHVEELNQRKQEEAALLEESRDQAKADLTRFFTAQEDEVAQNEQRTGRRQQELEAEIKALEDGEEKLDWQLVREIVDRVLGVTASEMESTAQTSSSGLEAEAARKNLDRLVTLAVKHQSVQRTEKPSHKAPSAARPTIVDELIM